MAVYGVLSDIHGNREALHEVLALFARRGVEQLLCLGDIVGFNADPDECAARLRERGALAVAGNHDLISVGRLGFERCSDKALFSLGCTRRSIAADTAAWLGALPARLVVEDELLLVHAGLRDVQQYLVSAQQFRDNARQRRQDFPGVRICFFGHTHERRLVEFEGEQLREWPADGMQALRADGEYYINPGSVDASRKREHKLAECAVFDSAAMRIEFLRLPYDHGTTERRAAGAGYRIGPWTERYYRLRRRLLGAPRRALAMVRRN